MAANGAPDRYGRAGRFLHWAVAALILALIAEGWWLVRLGYYDSLQPAALHWHRVLGLLALALGVAKIAWRLSARMPPPAEGLKPWERVASACVHWSLIALMVATPAAGYLISASSGAPIPLLWDIEVPGYELTSAARGVVFRLHMYLAYLLGALACLHAAAALKHHFIDKNDVLRRMLP